MCGVINSHLNMYIIYIDSSLSPPLTIFLSFLLKPTHTHSHFVCFVLYRIGIGIGIGIMLRRSCLCRRRRSKSAERRCNRSCPRQSRVLFRSALLCSVQLCYAMLCFALLCCNFRIFFILLSHSSHTAVTIYPHTCYYRSPYKRHTLHILGVLQC